MRRYARDSEEDGFHAEAAEAAPGHGRRPGTHQRTTRTNILTQSYRGLAESYISIYCMYTVRCARNEPGILIHARLRVTYISGARMAYYIRTFI